MFSNIDQGWLLTLLSSAMCVLGCSVIFVDDLYYLAVPRSITSKYKFELKGNYRFLTGSLAFSSGCLLFTALFRLLPESLNYLSVVEKHKGPDGKINAKTYMSLSFIGGMLVTLLFNTILHLATSESVVHCDHGGHDHVHNDHDMSFLPPHSDHWHDLDTHSHIHSDHESGHSSHDMADHGHSHSHSHDIDDSQKDPTLSGNANQSDNEVSMYGVSEATPLSTSHSPKMKRSTSIIHFLTSVKAEESLGECKGFSSAEFCQFKHRNNDLHFCEIPTLDEGIQDARSTYGSIHNNLTNRSNIVGKSSSFVASQHGNHDADFTQSHHHHVNSPFGRLLLIGIQTALAITIHKLPEGFITFVTSEADPQLGISIFTSLLVHNFTEGLSMCLPLYYSFSSSSTRYAKIKALSISTLLGGLSQPLGAFLGWTFLSTCEKPGDAVNLRGLDLFFGESLSVTSGFVTVIGLSMYGSAVSFGGSLNFVMCWAMCGVAVIALAFVFAHD